MKNYTRLFTLMLLAALITNNSTAQKNTKIAIDGRMGASTLGVTGRYYITPTSSAEGMYTISHNNYRQLFTGLYQEHFALCKSSGITWFAGAGMHIGYDKTPIGSTETNDDYKLFAKSLPSTPGVRGTVAGVDAIFGIEYKIKGTPIKMGVDIKPYVDFINSQSDIFDGALRLGLAF